ncbi:MAG TPA: SDR family oxidoreductase [Polyangia bacterium]|jgi:NAD(P)-dependent dehydrogenase (short-subunit alcohol dehydrogenase family)|nr:SDR family oxidoreductase [Polyangia bacterium]
MERHSSKDLADQRVVVVGGTSGMGRGTVAAAVRAGAHVISAGRRPFAERRRVDAPAGAVDEELVDVTDEASVRALFDRVATLDHLVVTAAPAPGPSAAFQTSDVAQLRKYLDDKLMGSLACARWAAPRMRVGGSITFVTGVAAIKPRAGMALVSVAFAAVEALARALAVELAPLRTNAIRPGFIDSDMWSFLDEQARQGLRDRVRAKFPVGRAGSVDDISEAALFLMTSSYVTGTVLEVTGGEQFVDAF